MWILAIINALGLICGTVLNETVMYILFGISFMAFFHQYALISWKLIYEKESWLVGINSKMDMAVANEFVSFFVMAGAYLLIATKAGALCVVVSALQCVIFQLLHLTKGDSDKSIIVAILFVAEFFVSLAYWQ